MSTSQNFADIWDGIAGRFPAAPALLDPAGGVTTWQQFEGQAAAVAAGLADAGVRPQSSIAVMLRNHPEYLVCCYAAFKLGLAPVNLNYRYTTDELAHVLRAGSVETVVAGAEFAPALEPLRTSARLWVGVSDESAPAVPSWMRPWPELLAGRGEQAQTAYPRSGDVPLLLFTGGTTGLPKGVVWRQSALLDLLALTRADLHGGPRQDVDTVVARAEPGERLLPVAPFMHGTGLFTSFSVLTGGGAVVCRPARTYDAAAMLDTVERCAVTTLVAVGNGQVLPLLDALDAGDARDLGALRLVISSGAALSASYKERLLHLLPQVTVVETLGASEGTGTGTAVAVAGSIPPTGRFVPGPHVRLLSADGQVLPLRGGVEGLLAVGGPLPDGYFHDEAATAAVYRVVDGERVAVPGDWAVAHDDGTIELLGRGATCVNTAGEKVYPAEVEAALLRCPGVREAAVVGVPDERYGEAVCAVIVTDGGDVPADTDIADALRATLAGYKVPRLVVRVPELPKTAVGKVDYAASRRLAVTAGSAR